MDTLDKKIRWFLVTEGYIFPSTDAEINYALIETEMVENFEEITEPLTADDLRFLPVLRRGLERHGKDDPIKAPAIVKALNDQRLKYDFQVKFTESRLRKLVNHLRTNGLLPVIATSSGYFVTYDPEIIRSQIRSLRDRASGIAGAANGLESFLE